jgi:hypothetical protein
MGRYTRADYAPVTRGAAFLAAAAAAALVLTGCLTSGPRLTQREYENEMQALTRDMEADMAAMQSLAAPPSPESFVQILEAASDALRNAADEMDGMNPPEEIDEAHGNLVDSFEEVADVLDEAAEQADDGDFDGAISEMNEGEDAARRMTEAIREIRTAGYYIGDDTSWGS